MPALWVVEHFDVVEHIAPGGRARQVDPPLDSLAFEQLEEALGHRVVVAIAAATHAANDAVRLQERLPFAARELAALVRMQHQAWRRLASPYRSQKRLQH